MEKCISKLNNKVFLFVCMKPITSGHHKKLVGGIDKSPVKFFAAGVQKHSCIRPTQSVRSRFMNVYDRFSSQSFKHNLALTIIKMTIPGVMYTIVNSR